MAQREAPTFPISSDALLSTMARLAATKGDAFVVAVLASSEESTISYRWYEPDPVANNLLMGMFGKLTSGWMFYLDIRVACWVYNQLNGNDADLVENKLVSYANTVLQSYHRQISGVVLGPSPTQDADWREKAWAWLTGKNVTNQGRVRSDNIASRTRDGLLFRSEQEILLYQALKSLGVSFAPLPVFIRGGDSYRRIEPDFVILKDGIVMIVEVDGDIFHRETPVEAHDRTTMMLHEGAHVERVRARDCDTLEKAAAVAQRLIQVMERIKASR